MTDLTPRQQRAAEKEAERAARDARQEAERQAREQAEQEKRFAASPIGRATAARDRGDTFFQIEILVSALAGPTSMFGSSGNATKQMHGATDLLGQIEELGWHLEHVGYVFVETGATSTNRVLQTGQGTVTRGDVRGVYLFRRTA